MTFTFSEVWSPLGRRYCIDCGCVDMPIRRVTVDDEIFNEPLCSTCCDARLEPLRDDDSDDFDVPTETMCHGCGDWSRDVVGSECPGCRSMRLGGAPCLRVDQFTDDQLFEIVNNINAWGLLTPEKLLELVEPRCGHGRHHATYYDPDHPPRRSRAWLPGHALHGFGARLTSHRRGGAS